MYQWEKKKYTHKHTLVIVMWDDRLDLWLRTVKHATLKIRRTGGRLSVQQKPHFVPSHHLHGIPNNSPIWAPIWVRIRMRRCRMYKIYINKRKRGKKKNFNCGAVETNKLVLFCYGVSRYVYKKHIAKKKKKWKENDRNAIVSYCLRQTEGDFLKI